MKPTSNWLEYHARFRPNAEALYDVAQDRRWTYAALHHDSLCWAGRLAQLGVVAGDRVAVLAQNRGETLALLFACAELGAILFPMNWRLSREELAWQLGNAAPRVLFTDNDFRSAVHELSHAIEDGPGDRPLVGPGSSLDQPWVLMYTSGSSGKPKGALLTHGQLHWNAINTLLACDLTPNDSTLTFTPLFHTGGFNCVTTPMLHCGGRVVLTRGVDAGQALQLIESEKISILMGVPTIYQMLADHPTFDTTEVSSVRDALCGGQALSLGLLERYLDRNVPLRQGFGMTEVGPNCFSMPHERVREKLGSVGLAIHHVAIKIARPDGTEADIDEPGELWFAGPAVFGGYFRDPEATARSFAGEWFRTGDILSKDKDGFFWVRGRLKEMYKSGGENVYPAEIEAVLQAHPAVAHAAVIGVPDAKWGEVGHAFIEARPGQTVTEADLRGFLDGKLARFKLPKALFILDALPRTASGKLDKTALRQGSEGAP